MLERTYRRAGMTLVELVVVIAIIGVLATLTALYFPRFQEGENVNRGADLLQGWLLIAKQQARRDGRPTGIRFLFDPSAHVTTGASEPLPTGTNIVSEIAYIQQPPDFSQGWYTGRNSSNDHIAQFMLASPQRATHTMNFPDPSDPVSVASSAIPVVPGDYLQLFGGGVPRRVVQVLRWDPKKKPPQDIPELVLDGSDPALDGSAPSSPTATNYRIIPQPRDLPSEQPLKLPDGVGILDNSVSGGNGSLNLPPNRQILFSPTGAVMGAADGQIMLWVQHLDPRVKKRTLITVQTRTGFIAAHPVSEGADKWEFAKDARSSGM